MSEASKDYDLSTLSVNAGLPGQTATVVNFTHNDLNGDGKLNKGESLSCKEPIVNLFEKTSEPYDRTIQTTSNTALILDMLRIKDEEDHGMGNLDTLQ